MNQEEYLEKEEEMTDDNIEVEIVVDSATKDEKAESETGSANQESKGKKSSTHTLKDALKQMETIGQALGEALQGRGNVVMVRVNDEALDHLDMLVEAEITKSRSESAAFLINEGITANSDLFEKISTITQKITALREQLRKEVQLNVEED
jgi:hypothetical protein